MLVIVLEVEFTKFIVPEVKFATPLTLKLPAIFALALVVRFPVTNVSFSPIEPVELLLIVLLFENVTDVLAAVFKEPVLSNVTLPCISTLFP